MPEHANYPGDMGPTLQILSLDPNLDENPQVDDFADWDIPQLQAEEKTGPKIVQGLAKAVNAAVTENSSKKSIQDIE